MKKTAEIAVAAADTLVVVVVVDTFAADNSVAHTVSAADTVVGVAADSAGVAHITVVLGTADIAVAGFVGAYSHPCMHGPLLCPACKIAPPFSFQLSAPLPQQSPASLAPHVEQ